MEENKIFEMLITLRDKVCEMGEDIKEIKADVKQQNGRLTGAELEIDRLKRDMSVWGKAQAGLSILASAAAAYLGMRKP